jgi:hypothetical protein
VTADGSEVCAFGCLFAWLGSTKTARQVETAVRGQPHDRSDGFRFSPRWFVAGFLVAIVVNGSPKLTRVRFHVPLTIVFWYPAELLLPRRLLPLREVAFVTVIVGLFVLSLTGRRSSR